MSEKKAMLYLMRKRDWERREYEYTKSRVKVLGWILLSASVWALVLLGLFR